ncbi:MULTISPECIES: hypothetical protein [unclassified Mesorhizobium]|uniref:hypothetical protein n=1 Tax=unclassified Mesorhizobium TaxID=325217 RepID=UPI000F761202|nr:MULTISPECIES: hypothetical protein [unclassified Mesorhizobium]AZO09534.1 hypothetical protein EJ074_10735 [Mesorhizobium sp. M3A.F.Ca.ET.080.04.2.1]RWB66151.1 MAG: hypothetical protein EOQ49_29875 [Mesorhizobium sp.]RWB81995.1 MAG: hypothetical protein EOQ52_29015 [Mesorhizobium sp.]RWE38077.1 MAG: hypothetical protein EOS77_00220 [Mesorhizobium sp.]RWF23974.1 MAG: hypothetical protein EOS64_09440 [Mesorhizobium sp.]
MTRLLPHSAHFTIARPISLTRPARAFGRGSSQAAGPSWSRAVVPESRWAIRLKALQQLLDLIN